MDWNPPLASSGQVTHQKYWGSAYGPRIDRKVASETISIYLGLLILCFGPIQVPWASPKVLVPKTAPSLS